MKVSDLFVKCLENEGIEYIFGVPGEENEDLLFSLQSSNIQFISTRHEQGAAFIANVWGRLTGRAGVCLSTLGPGATNLITGIADANLDSIVITFQTDNANDSADVFLWADLDDCATSVVDTLANAGGGTDGCETHTFTNVAGVDLDDAVFFLKVDPHDTPDAGDIKIERMEMYGKYEARATGTP